MMSEYLIQHRDLNDTTGSKTGSRSRVMTPGILAAISLFGLFFLIVVSSILAPPGTETIGMAILDFDQAGNLMETAVLSIVVMTVMALFAAAVFTAYRVVAEIRSKRRFSRIDALIQPMEGMAWRNQTLQEK